MLKVVDVFPVYGRHFDFSTFFFRALSAKVAIGLVRLAEASFGRVAICPPARGAGMRAQSGPSSISVVLRTVNRVVQESLTMSLLSLRGSRGSA